MLFIIVLGIMNYNRLTDIGVGIHMKRAERMKKKKGKWWKILLILLALLVVGGGVYLYTIYSGAKSTVDL